MKILVDINILLDMAARREPFYQASAQLMNIGLAGQVCLLIPGHAPATMHYLLAKYSSRLEADAYLKWLIEGFEVAPATHASYVRALELQFSDFEDAVVAAIAEQNNCDCIASRNATDFARSTIQALSPSEILLKLGND